MNGNYYSKFEEKMIVDYLEGALKELEDKNEQRKRMCLLEHIPERTSVILTLLHRNGSTCHS